MRKDGDKIGAILSSDTEKKIIYFLGYGTYVGDREVNIFEDDSDFKVANPCLELDNGNVVYGYQCWWGGKSSVEKRLEDWKNDGWEIKEVNLDKTEVNSTLESDNRND